MTPNIKSSMPDMPTRTIATDAYEIPLLQPDCWLEEATEGELSVDVYETPSHFIVQSTVAGVKPGDLSLALHRDLLTIRGKREACSPDNLPSAEEREYLTRECYWGSFSRSILLPEPIDVPNASATIRQGILTIILPKLRERTDIEVSELD
ncbi:MAG: Hsp20/alpha crystallin family protein [Candidatus Uhrbacteria bacterium]